MQSIFSGSLKINAIEDVLLISLVVHDDKFRRIKEAAAVERVGCDEVAPVLAPVSEVEVHIRGSKTSVRCGHAASGGLDPLTGARGHVNHYAGLVAKLGGRGTRKDLHRFDGIKRNLVGEHFALLVSDGLAIDREGVLGVIAEAMGQAIGVGCDARRG